MRQAVAKGICPSSIQQAFYDNVGICVRLSFQRPHLQRIVKQTKQEKSIFRLLDRVPNSLCLTFCGFELVLFNEFHYMFDNWVLSRPAKWKARLHN